MTEAITQPFIKNCNNTNSIFDKRNYVTEEGAKLAMEAYHEDETRWISVEERLPEVDNKDNPFGERIDCLVVYDGYVYKGQYMNIGEPFWSVSHIFSSSSLNVTKWILLPKP